MSSVNGGPSISQQANTQAVMEAPNTDTFGLANPSGTIGLTAVNGSATTAPRSDSAPALSQAITPTWTGAHIFSAKLTAAQVAVSNSVAALIATDPNPQIYSANGSGSAPFDSAGTLIIQPRTSAARDILFYTGNGTPTLRAAILGAGGLRIDTTIGFNGTAPLAKPTVTGSRGGNAALASLLTALASYGLVTDGTSA
jgi:hypothetical protein